MLRYFLIFDQICIFYNQLELISSNFHVICCWHAVFELKTGKILLKKRNFEKFVRSNFRFLGQNFSIVRSKKLKLDNIIIIESN